MISIICRRAGLALVIALIFTTAPTGAQGESGARPPSPPVSSPTANPGPSTPLVPLRLLVTIARYDGDKRVSSQPFTLWVNANDGESTRLTSGQQVPVATSMMSSSGGAMTPIPSYHKVGTSISASATQTGDGRFRVYLNVEDSSVVPSKDPDGMVTMQSLQTANLLLLRDGQNAEFLASSDKISGEVTRISVTATVLK